MTSGLQPIFSGAPTPVAGVTGGPGLPVGVASVDGTTGNVIISPGGNTTQLKKSASPQSLQVYESDAGPTNFQRLSLNAQIGGPFQLAVEVQPPGTIRDLQILATGNIVFNTNLQFTTDNAFDIGASGANRPRNIFAAGLIASSVGFWYPGILALYAGTGVPSAALGSSGDMYFNNTGAALTTIYQKRAGAWVGIL